LLFTDWKFRKQNFFEKYCRKFMELTLNLWKSRLKFCWLWQKIACYGVIIRKPLKEVSYLVLPNRLYQSICFVLVEGLTYKREDFFFALKYSRKCHPITRKRKKSEIQHLSNKFEKI
jgi:hypothetical protein